MLVEVPTAPMVSTLQNKMRLIQLLILTAAFISCRPRDTTKKDYRDTVIENYFSIVDSSGKFDTTDMSFKALKAYYNSDTNYLKQLDAYIQQQKTQRKAWDSWQSDIPLPKLNQLNAQTAFRFVFSIYGAPTYEVITITQIDTAQKLHYLHYYHNRDSSKFDKQGEFEKSISENDWREVSNKLQFADFWRLKSEKDHRGLDGNDLTVIGYQKFDSTERNHYVHRWGNTTLNDAFYYVYYKLLNNEERLFGTK